MSLISNYSGLERCPHCADSSMVCVTKRQQSKRTPDLVEEIGPCPMCEKGARKEFGLYKDKEGNEHQHERPPWGPQGFWRGREPEFFRELPRMVESKGTVAPEWFWVWKWCRAMGDDRSFPQQEDELDERSEPMMSWDDYGKTAARWIQAGSPTGGVNPGGEILLPL